jgi:methyl-accepting chemotaxis protein
MNILKFKKIKTTLFVLISLPILLIIIYASNLTIENYNNFKESGKLIFAAELIEVQANLIDDLQKERGRSGVFFNSKGKKFNVELIEQRKKTDSSILLFQNKYNEVKKNVNLGQIESNFDHIFSTFEQLNGTRNFINSFSGEMPEHTKQYTDIIKNLNDNITKSAFNVAKEKEIFNITNTLSDLLYFKESLGKTRGILSYIASLSYIDFNSAKKIANLEFERGYYSSNLVMNPDTNFVNILYEKLSAEHVVYVNGVYDLFKDKYQDSISIDTEKFFDQMSLFIESIKELEQIEIVKLKNKAIEIEKSSFNNLIVILIITILSIFITFYLLYLVSTKIALDLKKLSEILTDWSNGDLSKDIENNRIDEIGVIQQSLVQFKINLVNYLNITNSTTNELVKGNYNYKIEDTSQNGVFKDLTNILTNLIDSTKKLLNISSNINLMIGDVNGKIIYMNDAVINMLKENEKEIQKQIPGFNVNTLIGTNIDNFHKNPSHQHNILGRLKSTHKASIDLSNRIFDLYITPTFDNEGNKINYIVEWFDKTSTANFERRLNKVITAVSSGDLKYRLNSENITGNYLEVANQINDMLDNIDKPFTLTNNYVTQLSKGILPNSITDNFEGEFETIKLNLNSLINNLNMFIHDMDKMNSEHNNGFISQFINVDNFEGFYRQMASGVNDNVNAHINTKKAAINVFMEYGKGNFSANLELLPNEKRFINDAINEVQKNLMNFSNEMTVLVEAAQRGELSFRADTQKFSGDWSSMVNLLNDLLDKIVVPINEAGFILSELSKGDLTNRLNSNYGGDFEILKNNINNLVRKFKSMY